MCVTNTTLRRVQAAAFPVEGACPSDLSQRLMGTFTLPQNGVVAMPRSETDAYMIASAVVGDKPRPKRRRKPQKPGKTAKMNDRHFVEHNYHDHAADLDENDHAAAAEDAEEHRRRGGVAVAFPERLHEVLLQVEMDGLAHIISWQPHGRAFVVHKPREFVDYVMPRYFRQTKLTSFQRQLNLYGFNRLTRGTDAGGYYHELFLRGKEFLCKSMVRIKVKGTKFKAASSPEQEPDFYRMPPVSFVTPNHSSDEEASYDSSMRGSVSMTNTYGTQHMCYSSQAPMPAASVYSQSPVAMSSNFVPTPLQADSILDEAVDELFMGDVGSEDNLADFVNDWDTTNAFGNSFGAILSDDIQLGYMLEKLLED